MGRASDYLRVQQENIQRMADSLYSLSKAVEAVEGVEGVGRIVRWDTLTELNLAIEDVRRWDTGCADVGQAVYTAAMERATGPVILPPPPPGLFK